MKKELIGLNQYKITLDLLQKTDEKLKILELGSQDCILKKFLPKNFSYTSLDMGGNVDYVADLNKNKIPFKHHSFDIVVCLETLEHVLYPNKVMKEIKRVVKENGILILSMPNEYNFYLRLNYLIGRKVKQIDEPFMVIEKLQHIHKPRVKDILEFFNKYMEIEKVRYSWQSGKCKYSNFFLIIDKFINILAQIFPSLFCRIVVVKGRVKNNTT